jgi:hypothetical protein
MNNSPSVISFVNCVIVLRCVSKSRLIILVHFDMGGTGRQDGCGLYNCTDR